LARAALAAIEFGCIDECATVRTISLSRIYRLLDRSFVVCSFKVIALLSVDNVFIRPAKKREQVLRARGVLADVIISLRFVVLHV
jgi:hypothetical protein